jgi:hypothetical protein
MPNLSLTVRTRVGALASALLATTAAACTPLGGPDENACTGAQCVASIEIAGTRRYLMVGDTTRLQGEVLLRNGSATPFTWRAGQPSIVSVNDAGVVTGVARGRGIVAAVPTADTTVAAFVAFDVVTGDSSAVPYIVAVTDLATRSRVPYGGAVGDSIDVTLEYVVGRLPDQAITSAQLRIIGNARDTTFTLPATAAPGTIGRGSARIRFTPPAGSTTRPFPQGYYTAFTVLRLQSGRTLAIEVPQLFAVAR